MDETSPDLHSIEDIVQTYPKVLCFDIECIFSSKKGMPQPWKRDDRIEIISIVSKRYLSQDSTKYLLYVGKEGEVNIDECACVCCPSEDRLLEKFRDIILDEDPDVITGYNIFGFDFDY